SASARSGRPARNRWIMRGGSCRVVPLAVDAALTLVVDDASVAPNIANTTIRTSSASDKGRNAWVAGQSQTARYAFRHALHAVDNGQPLERAEVLAMQTLPHEHASAGEGCRPHSAAFRPPHRTIPCWATGRRGWGGSRATQESCQNQPRNPTANPQSHHITPSARSSRHASLSVRSRRHHALGKTHGVNTTASSTESEDLPDSGGHEEALRDHDDAPGRGHLGSTAPPCQDEGEARSRLLGPRWPHVGKRRGRWKQKVDCVGNLSRPGRRARAITGGRRTAGFRESSSRDRAQLALADCRI